MSSQIVVQEYQPPSVLDLTSHKKPRSHKKAIDKEDCKKKRKQNTLKLQKERRKKNLQYTRNNSYFLLAREGERHEDCIPDTIYTLAGLCSEIKNLRSNTFEGESHSYYVYIMRPNTKRADPLSDCDFTISWTEYDINSPGDHRTPKDHILFNYHIVDLMHLETQLEIQIAMINSLPQTH